MASLRQLATKRKNLTLELSNAEYMLSEFEGMCQGPECSICGGEEWDQYEFYANQERARIETIEAKLAKLGGKHPNPWGKETTRAILRWHLLPEKAKQERNERKSRSGSSRMERMYRTTYEGGNGKNDQVKWTVREPINPLYLPRRRKAR